MNTWLTLSSLAALEKSLLSRNPGAVPQVTSSYAALYGSVMPATDASQPVRDLVDGPAVQPIRVCLERNAQCVKGSIQLAGRKKPLRHLIGMSEEFASGNISAISGRTLLASSDNRFVWASIAHIHGIPGIPGWANWFADELNTHRAITRALGIGCDPVIVKGEKEQFLDWLSWGVESGAIRFPADTGSIRWPSVNLQDLFPQAEHS
jgi:hypothetical protein